MQSSEGWFWAISVILILGSVVYSGLLGRTRQYWDAVVGGFIATILGIAIGIPVALWLERNRATEEHATEEAAASSRTVKILSLLRDELKYNSARLEDRRGAPESLPREPFKDELYAALTATGDLGSIDDPSVVAQVSDAYHYIHIVRQIEERCYSAIRGINVQYPDGTLASQKLIREARFFDQRFADSLEKALNVIEASLSPLRS